MADAIVHRSRVRVVAITVGALMIASLAFLIRFNTLGGALAGFDDEEFNKLTRADLILAGEQPLRDFTDGELRGVWPSLSYELPAFAQRLWGRNLLTHAALTCGLLAICAALVFLLAGAISGSWVVGTLAASGVIASYPHLYNYPKVMVITVAVVLMRWTFPRPTIIRMAALAAWTVIAALFRHDLAVYVMISTVVGLVVCEPRPVTVPLRRLATYVAFGALFSVPSVVWVQKYAGIQEYLRDALLSVGAEGRRLDGWPVFDLAHPTDVSSLIAFNYYAFWAVAALGVVALAWRSRRRTQWEPATLALGASLVAMTLTSDYFFLRANLPARFGDGMAPVALLAAWLACMPEGSGWLRGGLARMATAGMFVAMCFAYVQINEIVHELATARMNESWRATRRQFTQVAGDLKQQPPAAWAEKPTERTAAVSRYLAECTSADDRVLLATFADDVAYFARRRFAGGQRRFTSGVLTTPADQRQVLRRLSHQSVPVAVTDPNYRTEFVYDYPIVAQHIEEHYRDVGVISTDGRPVLHVWVEKTRHALRTDPVLGFPCFQ